MLLPQAQYLEGQMSFTVLLAPGICYADSRGQKNTVEVTGPGIGKSQGLPDFPATPGSSLWKKKRC